MGKYGDWRHYYHSPTFPSHSRTNNVCFPCRRSVKQRRGRNDAVKCPECGAPMTDMGIYFKVPPRRSDNQWRKVKLVADAGLRFHSEGTAALLNGSLRTLAETKRAVAHYRARRWPIA